MRRFLLLAALAVACCCHGEVEEIYLPCATNHQHKLAIVTHLVYTLGYNECWEQPSWVIEHLTTNSFGSAKRKDDFREDPAVPTGSATLADYKKSGYDRGHMAPAADCNRDDETMSESFYLSNMSPQVPALNQQSWAKLEEWVRTKTCQEQDIVVVTGPIVTNNAVKKIGPSGVVVPDAYYKVVFDLTPPLQDDCLSLRQCEM